MYFIRSIIGLMARGKTGAGVCVCGEIVGKQFYPPLLIQLFAWMESHHLNKGAKCFTPLHIMELR